MSKGERSYEEEVCGIVSEPQAYEQCGEEEQQPIEATDRSQKMAILGMTDLTLANIALPVGVSSIRPDSCGITPRRMGKTRAIRCKLIQQERWMEEVSTKIPTAIKVRKRDE